jgi:uncharacterized protein (DUF1684 family)
MRTALVLSIALLATPASIEADTRAFHEKRIAALTRDDGWLTLVGLAWLSEGENRAGSAAGSEVAFPKDAPPRIGVFIRHGDEITLQAEPGVRIESGGKPVDRLSLTLGKDDDSQRFQVGRFYFSVIRRGDRLGVRIKDPEASVRKDFHGIPMFPPNAAWRIEARFEPAPAGSTLAVQNVLGQIAPFPTPGTAVFTVAGKEYRLTPTLEDDDLFFVFGDETNRDTTYGSGRFLDAALPKDGKVILDFNQAINPPCAFTAYATCPIPPKGNRLPLRVEAGEKRVGNH